jgi:para-aminobenzoate synthetase
MSILLVDSYDSFTYNLRDLLLRATDAHVITIHNDSFNLNNELERAELNHLLESVTAVVIGPGPGSPTNSSDIGIIPYIYKSCPKKPILGICLGFQILCLINNCTVDYLKAPIHGQVHKIEIVDHSSIFKDLPNFIDSVRYHSIFVDDITSSNLIKPLAYYTSEDNVKFLMAAQHKEKPHYGVQYHPESICSKSGFEMIKNFWNLIDKSVTPDNDIYHDKHLVTSTPLIKKFSLSNSFDYQYEEITPLDKTNFNVLKICDYFKSIDQDFMLLNSASAPGEWSIVGLPENDVSDVITHSTEDPGIILLSKWKSKSLASSIQSDDLFKYLSDYMSCKYLNPEIINEELKSCPFVGGLIGYMSYEEGSFVDIEQLQKRTVSNIDDTKLCFVHRFIAISPQNTVYIVSIKPQDERFISKIKSALLTLSLPIENFEIESLSKGTKITIPNKDDYFKTFHECQKYLHSGDSYELCLTYNTVVQIPTKFEPWDVYRALVKKNPSPYSAYLNFQSSMLLSTSPERFISWNPRFCQMRPIKGTLKKRSDIDYEKACQLLKIPKELGENLMIVDLIRDNLLFLLDKIEVTKLMSVEEYETIYQLVSVIEGCFTNEFKGIDVLKNSLPPGSMTGAPKKRSVEILQQLEKQQRRGLYSGICGYWSINDNADWSVIIRSLFRYADDLEEEEGFNTYRCGAGGALTVLSTDQGEWDEMLVKLYSVLQLFE